VPRITRLGTRCSEVANPRPQTSPLKRESTSSRGAGWLDMATDLLLTSRSCVPYTGTFPFLPLPSNSNVLFAYSWLAIWAFSYAMLLRIWSASFVICSLVTKVRSKDPISSRQTSAANQSVSNTVNMKIQSIRLCAFRI
jgi:hypothetical protein